MTYGGKVALPVRTAGSRADIGGALYLDNGVVLRPEYEGSIGFSDGYSAGTYTGPGQGLGRLAVAQGDLMILWHTVNSTSPNIGQPNNINNPWIPILTTAGQPLNVVSSGAHGSVRLRGWWKWATFDDYVTNHCYYITNGVKASTGLQIRGVPRSAFATDPVYDTEYGNIGPDGQPPLPSYVPVATVATGSTGGNYAPQVPTRNVGGKFRNVGIVIAATVSSYQAGVSFNPYMYEGVKPSPYYVFDPEHVSEGNIDCWAVGVPVDDPPIEAWGFSASMHATLDGRPTMAYSAFTNNPSWYKKNDAWIGVTLSVVEPYDWPKPTPGKTWADVADSFNVPFDTADSTGWLRGTNRPDQLLPYVSDGKLHLLGRNSLVRKWRVDFAGRSLVVGPIDYPATENGNNLWVTMTTDVYGTHIARFSMFSRPTAGGAEIRWEIVDDGYASAASQNYTNVVTNWDPQNTKYWRIRERDGVVSFEAGPDKLRWYGVSIAHPMLADQLAGMRVFIYTLGPGDAVIDEINPIVPVDTRPIPRETSWDYMGAPPALREQWHGRDVTVGICDQGSTKEVRAAQTVRMLARTYIWPAPGGGREIWPGAHHGCLVTPCGVPTGGQFVEAVISGSEGYTLPSLIASAVIWCAQRGAKVINLSFGGGGDDPIFDQLFAYLAYNYDVAVFISAGNDYAYGIAIPAAYCTIYSIVHSVGAFDELTNTRANFSNHHELVSGVTPGRYVGGRDPDGTPVLWNGTSASAPHAANICARLQTNRGDQFSGQGTDNQGRPIAAITRWSARTAAAAMDRNARPTGQPKSEEGGGAYDLGFALRTIGDPVGQTNIPSISMPRFVDGQWDQVTEGLNQLIDGTEALGRTVLLRYAGRTYDSNNKLVETNASIPSNQFGIVPWNSCDADTYGGMWTGGQTADIVEDGLYLIVLHLRYGTKLVDGTIANGAPYSSGQRGALIQVNQFDYAFTVASERKPASIDAGGTTVVVSVLVPLKRNDIVFGVTWQDSGQPIQCLQNDHGGNWMLVAKLAPKAPDLTGSLEPVTNFTATSVRYDQIHLNWTPPATTDLHSVLIRRKTGPVAPAVITEGDYVAAVPKGTTSYLDTRLTEGVVYSYAAFARSPGGYAPRAVATATTQGKPAGPAPVTNVRSTRRTTGNIFLEWDLPPNPDANNVTRAGIQVRRLEGIVAPSTPEGGVLLATLPATATSYNDTTVTPGGVNYSYSIFTYRAEQVFSTPATHVRNSARNISIFGQGKPNDPIPDKFFWPANSPGVSRLDGGRDPAKYAPGATVKDYYAQFIATFFWVRRPALFKGFRFLRPKPNIGFVAARLFERTPKGFFDVSRSPSVPFGTSSALMSWEDAVLPESFGYVPLTPYQMYYTVTLFPADLLESLGFFLEFAQNGLSDSTGLLVLPPSMHLDPTRVWYETLGDVIPRGANTIGYSLEGRADYGYYAPEPISDYPYDLHEGTVKGRFFWTDMIVNEI